METKRF